MVFLACTLLPPINVFLPPDIHLRFHTRSCECFVLLTLITETAALSIDAVLQLHTFILHTMSKRCSNFPPTFVYGEWGCSSYASRWI